MEWNGMEWNGMEWNGTERNERINKKKHARPLFSRLDTRVPPVTFVTRNTERDVNI